MLGAQKILSQLKHQDIHNVQLTVPGQTLRGRKELYISCLKLSLDIRHLPTFEKVNQVELDEEYAHVTVTINEPPVREVTYTSQRCSRCGKIGTRNGKEFTCPCCGHVDHADVNTSFNIALRPPLGEGNGRLHQDRDWCKGRIDTPQEATLGTITTSESHE